jgi:hypothetical protein
MILRRRSTTTTVTSAADAVRLRLCCAYHDVDHTGLPHPTREGEAALASAYNDKSVAEQNSVDVAWALLMDDSFSAIRVIYSNDDELKRFRQLVVNSVMATDIMDKDLRTKLAGIAFQGGVPPLS